MTERPREGPGPANQRGWRGDPVVIANAATGVMLATRARVAADPWTRLVGLMGRRRLAAGTGLVFPGTRQIHTHFMRVPIDVAFYEADGTVTHVIHALEPWRISPDVRSAAGIVELPAGTLSAAGVRIGDQLRFGPASDARAGAESS